MRPMHLKKKTNSDFKKFGILHFGGIGDWIIMIPAIRRMKERSPKTKIFVAAGKNTRYLLKRADYIDAFSLMPDCSVLENNFGLDEKIFVSSFRGFFRITRCCLHQSELANKILNREICYRKSEIPLDKKDEDYGIFHAKTFKNRMIVIASEGSYKGKEWERRKWERVIKSFPQYLFVQIGLGFAKPLAGAVNLVGKTTLAQAMSLVKQCTLLVGVDNVFNHVGNAFDTPRVILWGAGDPLNYGYSNLTINIWKKRTCSLCSLSQQQRQCEKGPQASNYDYITPCMADIKPDEVIRAIKTVLEAKHDNSLPQQPTANTDNTCTHCLENKRCTINSFLRKFYDLSLFQLH